MLDKKKFLDSLCALFVAKGKDLPSEVMGKIWYNDLKMYETNEVLPAMDRVRRKTTYGIQVSHVIEEIEGTEDEIGQMSFDRLIEEIQTKGQVESKFLTYAEVEQLRFTSDRFIHKELKERFLRRFKQWKSGRYFYMLDTRKRDKIPKEEIRRLGDG